MKLVLVLVLSVIAGAMGATIGDKPPEELVWAICGLPEGCNDDVDCTFLMECKDIAYRHDRRLIHCGVDIFQPHTCWAWTEGQPH
ncbi:hypothetical protein PAAG_00051 [Paracoccidioides lutzii Pb01]|uniref:Uncharacterized protein n=1 Tax=Paracoccidioides lutzii (strain ATCC MYA-826 / Pb01) TaxID=502779 RepID=C1GNF6_PARBA|nr:hypothetical protein PAAG_00051 [Paracoccidioides lutzii Pb01]EEH35728.2 hypothetical protein PAAG_00051 [Paracoccidioides lutzii Pb01]